MLFEAAMALRKRPAPGALCLLPDLLPSWLLHPQAMVVVRLEARVGLVLAVRLPPEVNLLSSRSLLFAG